MRTTCVCTIYKYDWKLFTVGWNQFFPLPITLARIQGRDGGGNSRTHRARGESVFETPRNRNTVCTNRWFGNSRFSLGARDAEFSRIAPIALTATIMVIVSGGFRREIISPAKFRHHARNPFPPSLVKLANSPRLWPQYRWFPPWFNRSANTVRYFDRECYIAHNCRIEKHRKRRREKEERARGRERSVANESRHYGILDIM